MKAVLVIILLVFSSASSAIGDEATVVADFKTFAEQENARFRAKFDALAGKFLSDPVGTAMPLTLPRKYEFSGVQLESAPATYSYDIRRTDSLISPYAGHLEWPLVFLKATTHAKGPAEFCNQQPLQTCLEHGGSVFETDMMYKNSAVRVPKTVRYEYVYQDGQWKPKKTLDEVLAEIVASLNLAKPVGPTQVPNIFGIPRPTQPTTPPSEGEKPPE